MGTNGKLGKRERFNRWSKTLFKPSAQKSQEDSLGYKPLAGHAKTPTPTNQSGRSTPEEKDFPETDPENLWESAYNLLDESQKDILSKVEVSRPQQTREIIDAVIETTEARYEEYKKGGLKFPSLNGKKINVREASERIITAALSFKDVITPLTALDPTQHAAGAWGIVSFGLTMMGKHYEARDALFGSSEYLASALARSAFVEKNCYRGKSVSRIDIGQAITRMYKAILLYTVQVQKAQSLRKWQKLLDCISAMTTQLLEELQSSIDKEEQYLQQWIDMDQHLQRREEAENILNKIDETSSALRALLNDSAIKALNSQDAACINAYQNDDGLLDDLEGKCLDGTRTELLGEVMEWATSPGKTTFWLNGMAGTGKSTVSRTLAASLESRGVLGASFFFKRGEGDRGDAKRLFTTVARQLVSIVPQMIPAIKEAVQVQGGITEKTIEEQFKRLLLQPLLDLDQPTQQMQPIVIVIDALDECDSVRDIETLLQPIPQAAQVDSIPLRFFLTSRPGLPRGLGFDEIENADRQGLILHEIQEDIIERDLSKFLDYQMQKIRQRHYGSRRKDWPGQDTIQHLVEISSPLFIFAATICLFVGDRQWQPHKRRENFLDNPAIKSSERLNRTYLPILEQPLKYFTKEEKRRFMREFHTIIGTIVILATPLSVSALASVTGIEVEDIANRLGSFRSVLSFSDDFDVPVRALHLSFRDFLLNTDTEFHVDEKQVHSTLAAQCIRIMESLRRNICDLPNAGADRAAIEAEIIKERFSPELQYSCRYWVHRIKNCKDPTVFETDVLSFLKTHILHWFEAISILGVLKESVGALDTLRSLFESNEGSELVKVLIDARRFIVRNMEGVSMAPLQLYVSALIFSPHNSIIRNQFQQEIPDSISRQPTVDQDWGLLLHTLDECNERVLQFSPDGELLATSREETIYLYDTTTWDLRKILKHRSKVNCVTFSQENLLAAGSKNGLVIVWETTRWTKKYEKCYRGSIQSISFSPCDDFFAAASENNICVSGADLTENAFISPIYIGDSFIVRFSPCGKFLVAICYEVTIIWETRALELDNHRTLEYGAGHLSFSPDGKHMGISWDNKIIVLETERWTIVSTEQFDHAFNGVSLSRDGELVAAASRSNAVEIFKTQDFSSRIHIKGHGTCVCLVSFSPTKDILASSDLDSKVKLWAIPPDILSHSPQSSPYWDHVFQVVFSPTGKHVASRARGSDVKLWDTETGREKSNICVGDNHEELDGLQFSLDGRWLLTRGSENDIMVWDTYTGEVELEEPIPGGILSGLMTRVYFDEEGLVMKYQDSPHEKRYVQFKPVDTPQVEAGLKVTDNWVVDAASGQRIIWLPSEYRPWEASWESDLPPEERRHFACAVHNRTVAWGTGSGNVYFMEIS